ncbi:MAG: hypothetical protein WC146_00790 [Patescibacteria group bacterium]|jgi:hypothetical protein
MKKISKHLISLAIISFLVMPILAIPALAQTDPFGINSVNNEIGLSSTDPKVAITRVIKIALSFLAIIAVVIVLFGGFKWMTSMGNEEKASEAKKILGAGVIGLVIILSAWALANFAINTLANDVINGA